MTRDTIEGVAGGVDEAIKAAAMRCARCAYGFWRGGSNGSWEALQYFDGGYVGRERDAAMYEAEIRTALTAFHGSGSATGGDCTCPKGVAPTFDLIDKACPQHAATGGGKGDAHALGCEDCGLPYSSFPLDVVLPNDQWHAIQGREGGLLCAACILVRGVKLPGVTVAKLHFPDLLAAERRVRLALHQSGE